MHPPQVREQALALIREGVNDCEVSRRLEIPRTTIRDWRRSSGRRASSTLVCPRCWRQTKLIRFTPADYCEFLGLYLGDGCISRYPRAFRLRIALDLKYPQIINDAQALLERCFPSNRVAVVSKGVKGRCVQVSVYSEHLPCLLPQHGAGPKHRRRIALETWQRQLLQVAPFSFLRGCIRSDGCVFINKTGPYEYLSYGFTNSSREIARMFADACGLAGVACRLTGPDAHGRWHARVNRRASVVLMLEHVGRKS